MNRLLLFLSIILTLIVFISAVWIIVPAPSYYIWLFSVAASEWSLWLGIIALIGIILSLSSRLIYNSGSLWLFPMSMGIIALSFSLFPLLSVLSLARDQHSSLSFSSYFEGLKNANNPSSKDFTTQTFARIDGKDLQLDIYQPTAETENNGAGIIVIHGGSWSGGNRNDFPQWNNWLAAQGFTVFDVDYRLDQPNYLTATGDVKSAVLWVKKHAAEFKISQERIALIGRSAGAHLALLAAYAANDPKLPATNADEISDENVRAVISIYAPIELLWAYDNPANPRVINGPQTLSNFLGGDPHASEEIKQRFVLATPTAYVSPKTPPTLLIHGGHDQLVRSENMYFLAENLKAAGANYKTIFIPYAQHGYDYNFYGWGSQITRPIMLNFLQENTKIK